MCAPHDEPSLARILTSTGQPSAVWGRAIGHCPAKPPKKSPRRRFASPGGLIVAAPNAGSSQAVHLSVISSLPRGPGFGRATSPVLWLRGRMVVDAAIADV